MSKEIDNFKRIPEHIQSSAECNAVDVIYESFVVPGDQDYLMSRLMAQKGFPRGFYWAAAQATEKYLKAFLLMNGEGVRELKFHPIKALFKSASKIDSSFANLCILPHQSIQVDPSASHLLKNFTIQSLIDDLEKHGHPDNRYNTFGIDYNTGHLFALDSLAFQVRGKIGAIPINESFNKFDTDLIATFEKCNPWFQTGTNHSPCNIPCDEFRLQLSSSVTKFEFLINNESNPAYNLALQWLRTKMKLPR